MTNSNYYEILNDSLKKKIAILERIEEANMLQKEAASGERLDEEKFEKSLALKDELISEIEELDKGFETVYNRVKEDISSPENKEKYKNIIEEMKKHISKITELTMNIGIQEKHNQKLVMEKLSADKKEVMQARSISKAASSYYNNMNKVNYIDPQFMDKKQ